VYFESYTNKDGILRTSAAPKLVIQKPKPANLEVQQDEYDFNFQRTDQGLPLF
jgi:hypothetical protein